MAIFLSQSCCSFLVISFFAFTYFVSFILIIILLSQFKFYRASSNKLSVNLVYLAQITLLSMKEKYCLIILLLSLSGLPPFMGFYVKVVILQSLFENHNYAVCLVLILCSLIMTFAYLRFSTY